MNNDDLSKTAILREIRQKAHENELPDLPLSEGGHTIDSRGLPLIGVLEIELRDQNEIRDFERQIKYAQDIWKGVR